MMKQTMIVIAISVAALVSTDAFAGGFKGRFAKQNNAGGVTAGKFSGFNGQNGAFGRGKGFYSDGQGNTTRGKGTAFNTQNGQGGRGSLYQHNADGSSNYQSQTRYQGDNGSSYNSTGNWGRTSDGTFSGSKTTTATNQNGGTYNGSTTYSDGTLNHSGTCTNAYGEIVSCR